jgi:hypothetical protein
MLGKEGGNSRVRSDTLDTIFSCLDDVNSCEKYVQPTARLLGIIRQEKSFSFFIDFECLDYVIVTVLSSKQDELLDL